MLNVHGIKVAGGTFPAMIWARFMKSAANVRSKAVTDIEGSQAPSSEGLVLARVCEDSLELANSRCPRTIEVYLDPALVPRTTCKIH
jgi:hypothetical protein